MYFNARTSNLKIKTPSNFTRIAKFHSTKYHSNKHKKFNFVYKQFFYDDVIIFSSSTLLSHISLPYSKIINRIYVTAFNIRRKKKSYLLIEITDAHPCSQTRKYARAKINYNKWVYKSKKKKNIII